MRLCWWFSTIVILLRWTSRARRGRLTTEVRLPSAVCCPPNICSKDTYSLSFSRMLFTLICILEKIKKRSRKASVCSPIIISIIPRLAPDPDSSYSSKRGKCTGQKEVHSLLMRLLLQLLLPWSRIKNSKWIICSPSKFWQQSSNAFDLIASLPMINRQSKDRWPKELK